MTEPLDDARGELLALADYLDAGHNYLSDPEMIAKYKRWSATLRAPVTQCEAEPDNDPISLKRQAAEELDRQTSSKPWCSCKASQRNGQHMAWCPASLVPPPSEAGRDKLIKQALAAADGIDLLQDSRSLRRRTAEILRELVAALSPDPGTVAVASTHHRTPTE